MVLKSKLLSSLTYLFLKVLIEVFEFSNFPLEAFVEFFFKTEVFQYQESIILELQYCKINDQFLI